MVPNSERPVSSVYKRPYITSLGMQMRASCGSDIATNVRIVLVQPDCGRIWNRLCMFRSCKYAYDLLYSASVVVSGIAEHANFASLCRVVVTSRRKHCRYVETCWPFSRVEAERGDPCPAGSIIRSNRSGGKIGPEEISSLRSGSRQPLCLCCRVCRVPPEKPGSRSNVLMDVA